MYQLTWIVVHYYALTCCWDTGTAFKLNDCDDIEVVCNDEFDCKREKGYMLLFNKITNEHDTLVNPTEITNNLTEAHSRNKVSEID